MFANAIIDNWAQRLAGYHSWLKLANYSCHQCLKSWFTFWCSEHPHCLLFFNLFLFLVKVFFYTHLGYLGRVCFCLLLKPKHSGYNWHYREGSAARNCFLSRLLIKLSARLWGWNSGGTSDQILLSLAHWQAMTLKDWIFWLPGVHSHMCACTYTHTQTYACTDLCTHSHTTLTHPVPLIPTPILISLCYPVVVEISK